MQAIHGQTGQALPAHRTSNLGTLGWHTLGWLGGAAALAVGLMGCQLAPQASGDGLAPRQMSRAEGATPVAPAASATQTAADELPMLWDAAPRTELPPRWVAMPPAKHQHAARRFTWHPSTPLRSEAAS